MIKNVGIVLAALAFCLVLAEGFLRVIPELIPVGLLVEFNPKLSKEVAERTGLQTTSRFRELQRDDGGPPLLIPRPNESFVVRVASVDRELGGTERQVTDANGMCNPAVPEHAAVIAVGDSFTWCTGIDANQTWSARLGGLVDAPTYNVSRPSEGMYEYLQMLKQFGLALEPDIVVLAVYEGNDLRDALRYWTFREKSGHLPSVAPSGMARQGPAWPATVRSVINQSVLESSYVANFLAAAVLQLDRRHHKNIDFRYSVLVGGSRLDMNVEDRDRDEVEHAYLLASDPDALTAWDAALAQFVELADKSDFIPVVLYIPSAYTAYSRTVTFQDRGVGQAVRKFSDMQRSYLEQQSKRLGYRYVDASRPLADLAVRSEEPLYFPASVHLAPAGDVAIAQILAVHVKQLWENWQRPDETGAAIVAHLWEPRPPT